MPWISPLFTLNSIVLYPIAGMERNYCRRFQSSVLQPEWCLLNMETFNRAASEGRREICWLWPLPWKRTSTFCFEYMCRVFIYFIFLIENKCFRTMYSECILITHSLLLLPQLLQTLTTFSSQLCALFLFLFIKQTGEQKKNHKNIIMRKCKKYTHIIKTQNQKLYYTSKGPGRQKCPNRVTWDKKKICMCRLLMYI